MRKFSLLSLILLASCAGGINFFSAGESNNSPSRPSEEDEGIPGYLVDPEFISSYRGKNGKVYIDARPGFVDRSKIDNLHVLAPNLDRIPNTRSELSTRLNNENKVQIEQDGSFRFQIAAPDGPFVIILVGTGEFIEATILDLNGDLAEVETKIEVTANMCLLQTYPETTLKVLDQVFVDLYIKCDLTLETLKMVEDSMRDFVCVNSKEPECKHVKHLPLAQSCSQKLDYDSQNMQCEIELTADNSGYKYSDNKAAAMSKMIIRTPKWISTDEVLITQITKVDPPVDAVSCSDKSRDDRKLFVNSFEIIGESTEIKVEAIADDNATIFIWKDGDPEQEVLKIIDPYDGTDPSNPNWDFYLTGQRTLEPGHYVVIADVIDFHNFGHSVAMAIHKTRDKSVILETTASSEWCVFDILQTDDIETVLKSSASCLSCYNGRGSF